MAKNGKNLIGKKIVKKDFASTGNTGVVGANVPVTFSADNINNVPPTGSTQGTIMYWPSPQLFYQQGKDLAKKAYNEYLNATNQYTNVPPDQFDQKMQAAGQMNNLAQSMIQGINVGTEAAENIAKRERTGDQSALIEMGVVKDILTKLLKTVWVHNKAAASGQFPGLEAKLIEAPLVTRLNQSTKIELTNYGVPVGSAEDADSIWVDREMPVPSIEIPATSSPEGEQLPSPEQEALTGEESPVPQEDGSEDIPIEEEEMTEDGVHPEETEEGDIEGDEEEIPIEEDTTEEGIIPEGNEGVEEPPVVEEDKTEVPIDESGEEIPTDEEIVTEPSTEEGLPEEGLPEEDVTEEEVPTEEEEVIEEIPEEETEEPVDEEGLPLPTGPDGLYTKDDMLKYGQMIVDQITDEEGTGDEEEEVIEEENPEGEEEITEEEEIGDEDKPYCIMCDQYVSPEEIDACDNEKCPFKVEMEEEETDENEIPVDSEEEPTDDEEEIPVEEEEVVEEEIPEKEKKEIDSTDIIEKHFIMMNKDDHEGHNIHGITIKEFTGLEGEYCLDCNCMINYSFDQKTWTSEDAKNWVHKQNKINKQKNISSEEIIVKSLDNIPEEVLQQWLVEKKEEAEIKTKDPDEIEIDVMKEVLTGDVLRDVLTQAFEPLTNRLKILEM